MRKLSFYNFLVLILLLLLTIQCKKTVVNNNNHQRQNDSIIFLIKQAKTESLNIHKRKLSLQNAYSKNTFINNDSLKAINLSSIAYEYYELNDSISFFKTNNEAFKLARQIDNPYIIGDVHWSFANFYKKIKEYEKAYYHYNNAYQNFTKTNHIDYAAIMLYGMAFIKGRYRDYSGSEILTIKAIKLFNQTENYRRLYSCYNHLGLIQYDIKEYQKALTYYDKAIENYKKSKKKKYIAVYNNIGNIYKDIKNYKKALYNYNLELNNKLTPTQQAIILNNKAHCKLLMNDTLNIKKDFYKALAIRDSLNNKEGILTSKIHISDYYKYTKDTIKALQYAKEANLLAKDLKNGRDYLTTLNQLANLDKQNSKKYLDRYIEFNDSLISAERRIQNKFTRIEFETDEYIEETERLSQQRIWIIVTSFAGLLVLSLLYFLRVQKVRNEKLKLEAEQQKANEEVYVLTLQQQAKLEEERVNERNRISAELHDGVLGKLFGTRVNLGFLAMQMKPETQEKHQAFLDELQEIEKEIRDVSHRLSDNFDSSNINFTTILTQLLKDRSTIGNFSYKFNFDKTIPWNEINEVTKANVYRIIQEALQNIIKHAKAKNVTLDASFKREELIISLKDDGIGFNAEKKKKGIGIKNITARVQKLGGTLEFISKENQGTTLVIITPFNTKNGK
ncbi:tetratricopeptide repeat protein [Tenacibaculum sp. Mcav3-52]|uniref:tetratricopeptide repeat-containing sensor histidine kinase n=1 Tax=Tenacibaculum sp. Mcav3-52 TaxID=2917762 RepID=UPI001EF31631|nr:tetratricopeptide repeat-containing sensor histidine kinase [Tenacibaculum sp. Mcav3-52]MCG7502781.1 tetratricopeptide repeat protein [Tenacibaculum sp. Mcav3-52]